MRRVSLKSLFVVVAIAAAVVWLGTRAKIGDARYAAERVRCQQRLRMIWLSLSSHVEESGDLPRDEHGRFIIPDGIPSICPAHLTISDNAGYFVNARLTLEEFRARSSNTYIVADPPGRHPSALDDNEFAVNVLCANGHVITLVFTGTEYTAWCAKNGMAALHGQTGKTDSAVHPREERRNKPQAEGRQRDEPDPRARSYRRVES